MKFTIYQPNSRRLALSALFAAAIAFGAPSVANAEDPSWDIDVYDRCIDLVINDDGWDDDDLNTVIDNCCNESGGITTGMPDAAACVAPPADPAGRSPGAPGGPGAPPKPGAGAPPQVSDPSLAPPPTPTTTPLIAPAPAPGLAPR